MRRLRIAHGVSVLLAGAAVGFDQAGMPRVAVTLLAVILLLLAWSLETIRYHLSLPENER